MNFRLVFSLVLVALVLIFTAQNVEVIGIRFLFWTVSMSRALMIFFVLAVGLLVGWLLRGYAERREARR